ncbi:hypothetical protein Nmel_012999, partial [Mimus melanotis]
SLFSTQTDNVFEHDCLQTVEEIYFRKPDLKDVPDWELCADKSSFMQDGKQVTREKAVPSNVSSQKAELITSMEDLKVRKVTWKERRLVTIQEYLRKSRSSFYALQSIMFSKTPELKNSFSDKIVKGAAEKGILTVVPQKEINFSRFALKCDLKGHQFSGTKAEIQESD